MLIIVGFLVMIVLTGLLGLFTSAPGILLDLPSAVIILGPLVFFLAVTKSGKIIGNYFVSSFKKDYVYTKAELTGISVAVKNTIRFILGSGGFGFLIGIIASLAYLGSTEYIGPNLAISLLTVLYAIALSYFTFFPLRAWAENKLNLQE